MAFCAFLLLTPPAQAQSPAEPPLNHASRCYAQSDLLCVVQVLEHAAFDRPEDQDEALRLLAFAFARLDRHAEARKAFAQWLMRQPRNRLERASTPPAIFEDYAAAQLLAHESELDLQPHLELQAVLPPPAVSPTDLPHFAPQARSARDQANDFAFGLQLGTALDSKLGQNARYLPAGQMTLDLLFSHGITLGLGLGAHGAAGSNCTTTGNVVNCDLFTALVAPVSLRVGVPVFYADKGHWLGFVAGIGGSVDGDDVGAAVSLAMRYAFIPAAATVGWSAEVRRDLGVPGLASTGTLLVGVYLRPKPKPSAKGTVLAQPAQQNTSGVP